MFQRADRVEVFIHLPQIFFSEAVFEAAAVFEHEEMLMEVNKARAVNRKRSFMPLFWLRVFLACSVAVLLTMPVVYLLFSRWVLLLLFMFVVNQCIVTCLGAFIVILCGWRKGIWELRRYGLWVAFFGSASLILTFWLTALATFGGPPFGFGLSGEALANVALAQYWIFFCIVVVPAAWYLRRQAGLLCVSAFRNAAMSLSGVTDMEANR